MPSTPERPDVEGALQRHGQQYECYRHIEEAMEDVLALATYALALEQQHEADAEVVKAARAMKLGALIDHRGHEGFAGSVVVYPKRMHDSLCAALARLEVGDE